ncbi:MAG: DUF262 domain-containing protein [Bacteroidetes bacterium]|nr:DUF262 domain-containing protein [Bacteroidota bacterium]
MATLVNLDALLKREDFDIVGDSEQTMQLQTIQIRDLEPTAFFYVVLRKPVFQRETADWNTKKVVDFIQCFLSGDLIPSIILWRTKASQVFVIDGAHRLSALIAWVNDDYGDGDISKSFFEFSIPEDQVSVANKTRDLIHKSIGSYKDHKFAAEHPERSTTDIVERVRQLATLGIQVQWVKGTSEKAEAAFFKINQEPVTINKTEIRLLQSRNKPNAVAARAIIRSGTGHKYWSAFNEENKLDIESIAKNINEILFVPSMSKPVKTLDLPIGGQVYSAKALPLVLDLVNLTNDNISDKDLDDDIDGYQTIKFLNNTKRIVYQISGMHASSLGLHPIVYFYSVYAYYQPTSFFAIVSLIMDFHRTKGYKKFIDNRAKLEKFLLQHKDIQNQVAVKYGVGLKGQKYLVELYNFLIDEFDNGVENSEVISKLQVHQTFRFLKLNGDVNILEKRKDFSTETKSAAFIREALQNPLTCSICGGLIHSPSITFDHKIRKQNGGKGNLDNAQIAHPYCNTTYKN